MFYPIFMNKGVGLRNKNAVFLHDFSPIFLKPISNRLTICVFADLTRKLILHI